MKNKVSYNHWLLTFLGIALITASYFADKNNNTQYLVHSRTETTNQLLTIRSHLEADLLNDIHAVKGLVSLISTDPELGQENFSQVAKSLFDDHSNLRNLGAAPDMVIRMIFPVAGNEKAIGLDYRKVPVQWDMANQARTTGKVIFGGPIQLVQGGTGLIAEFPVFIDNNAGESNFWGLISAVIDTEKLFRAITVLNKAPPLEVSIRKINNEEPGIPFFGNPDIFKQTPVFTELKLPGTTWQLAAQPQNGWPTEAEDKLSFRLYLLFIILLVFIPCYLLVRTSNKLIYTEGQLDLEKARLLRTIESTPNVAVQWYDSTGRVIYWNNASEEVFGWTAKEAIGKNLNQLIFTDTQTKNFIKSLAAIKSSDTPRVFDTEATHKDGSKRVIHSSTFSISNSTELIFVCMDVDITKQWEAEAKLRKSHQKYQHLVDNIGEQFIVYSHDIETGRLHYVSEGIESVTGISRSEAIGKSWTDIIPWEPDFLKTASSSVQRLATGKTSAERFEVTFTHPDGNLRTLHVSSHLSLDNQGKPCIDGIVENITERKNTENVLRLAATAFETQDAITITDTQGKILSV